MNRRRSDMGEIYLYDIILKSAERQLQLQNNDGGMPAGHNGPWQDLDTPVRDTAHCALLFYKAYEISKDDRFLKATLSTCEYLVSKKVRPHNASFVCFLNKDKSAENGLIGQAWAVEPLIFIGRALGRRDYLNIAQEVLTKHAYDERLHVWHNLYVNGGKGEINPTFNQQLWFAAMNLILGKEIGSEVLLFRARDLLRHLRSNLAFLEPGLIQHTLPDYLINKGSLGIFNKSKMFFKRRVLKTKETGYHCSEELHKRSIGYLPFNLYAFALCYSNAPAEDYWAGGWLKAAISEMLYYVQREEFLAESYTNPYAWSYNPFGFEIGYALYAFRDFLRVDGSEDTLRHWVEKQLVNHLNFSSGLLEHNTVDSVTLSARLYEATRLPNIALSLSGQTAERT